MVKKLSNKRKIDLGEEILKLLGSINEKFPALEHRFKEIEVS